MKILIATDAWTPQVNGVVRHIQSLTRYFQKHGIVFRVVSPQDFSVKIACSPKDQVEWVIRGQKQFHQICTEFCPTHIHSMTEGSVGLIARKYAKKKSLCWTSSFHSHWACFLQKRYAVPPVFSWKYLQWFHTPAKAVCIPTQNLTDIFAQKTGLSQGVVLHNALPEIFFASANTPALSADPQALFVGRIAPEKNISAFLECPQPIQKIVVGEGPEKKSLIKQYPEVQFLGLLEEESLIQQYQNATVFVFPSQSDTFGIVLLEALSFGLPLACLPSPAVDELSRFFPEYFFVDSDINTAIGLALQKKERIIPPQLDYFSGNKMGERFVSILLGSISI